MKRLIILAACAALLTSGCKSCPWFKKNRGAPCRSALTFDPYTTAPSPAALPGCGIDGYASGIGCGNDMTVGYGTPDCPNCQPGGVVGGSVDYYPDGAIESMPGAIASPPPVVEPGGTPAPPVGPMAPMGGGNP